MTSAVPTSPAGEPTAQPWPEPWRTRAGSRPRTVYWDVTRACWSCDVVEAASAQSSVPEPRPGS